MILKLILRIIFIVMALRTSARRLSIVVAFVALALAGCSGAETPTPDTGDGSDQVFIALEKDFDGFTSWSQYDLGTNPGDGIHGNGDRIAYLNKVPPHGSATFPVGTIILKETNDTDPTKRTAFAMVKRQPRGTGFNSASSGGDDGWEWWSVSDLGNCNVARLWRGPAPPSSETYAGTTVGDCNGCHGRAVGNDYVWDTALQLSHF